MDIILLLAWGLLLLVVGYLLPNLKQKRQARLIAWLLVGATTIFATFFSLRFAPLYRMLAIISLQLMSLKPVVLVETYLGKNKKGLTWLQWCAFVGWFGMRPQPFERLFSPALPQAWWLVGKGVSRIMLGIVLLYCSRWGQASGVYYAGELMTLVGLSFVLHFGILNVSTGVLRALGVDVRELFRAPYKSKSLREFWGKRWNMAFSEMMALIVYKPLKKSIGDYAALVMAFAFSGILHEIAISLPVLAGFGLPLIYFVLHSVVMRLEDKISWVKRITAHFIWGRVWTMVWLILPMPILFHHWFIAEIVFPLRALVLFPLV